MRVRSTRFVPSPAKAGPLPSSTGWNQDTVLVDQVALAQAADQAVAAVDDEVAAGLPFEFGDALRDAAADQVGVGPQQVRPAGGGDAVGHSVDLVDVGQLACTRRPDRGVLALRGSLRLAVVAALQYLPARQRAVLILREVLQRPAADVAACLGMTTAAVNSALQRGRVRLGEAGLTEDLIGEPTQPDARAQVDRYMTAFLNADLATLEQLITDDATLEMPPFLNWFHGRRAYLRFIVRGFTLRDTNWRMLPTAANGQPAVAAYIHSDGGHVLHSLQVFTVTTAGISHTTVFQDQAVLDRFGPVHHIPAATA